MPYVVIILVVVVGGFAGLGLRHVRHENAPGARPSMLAARQAVRQSHFLASGQLCVCGGTLADTGETSPKLGALLSCPGCGRSWTMDGHSVVGRGRRRRATLREVPDDV